MRGKHRFDVSFRIPASQEGTPQTVAKFGGWSGSWSGIWRHRRAGMTPPAARSRHIPVLDREVLAWLKPHDGGIYVDATFGAGG